MIPQPFAPLAVSRPRSSNLKYRGDSLPLCGRVGNLAIMANSCAVGEVKDNFSREVLLASR